MNSIINDGRRIRPVNDLLFRRVLGNAQHPDITKGFISSMLGIEVKDVFIENPYSIDLYKNLDGEMIHRNTVVDVLVSLDNGSRVIVEMQTTKQAHFIQRELFYVASRYADQYGAFNKSRQSGTAESLYGSLYPVHAICVLDFMLFTENDDPLSHFVLYDIEHGRTIGNHSGTAGIDSLISLSFLELPKPYARAGGSIMHWIDFFHGHPLDENAPDYFEAAYRLVSEQDWSFEEKMMIDYYELAEADRLAQIDYGRQEGFEQGLEQGLEQSRHDIARAALLKGFSLDCVAELTGLAVTDLAKLQTDSIE